MALQSSPATIAGRGASGAQGPGAWRPLVHRLLGFTLTAALMLIVSPLGAARAGDRVNSRTALVARGVSGDFCDPNAIARGSDPTVKPDQDVQNLSVNCDADGGEVSRLRSGLPQPHVCWARLEELTARNNDIILETDPVEGNPKHCLIRDITPNQIVKALHYRG